MEKSLKEFIRNAWGTQDSEWFPGPQPISIERRHFPMLKRQPYLVCEKTDGTRYMLVSWTFEERRVSVLVDRAFQTRPVAMAIPRDTVLDGELVQGRDGKWLYMIYDAVLIKGQNVAAQPLTERLAAAAKLIKGVLRSTKDAFEMRVKTMLPLESIHELKPLDQFPYETDGIVLTPVNEPVRTGTHETLFKWKPHDRITIDFLVYGKYLCVQDKGQIYPEAEVTHQNVLDGTIVECGYGDKGWYPVKVRTDKTHPNNRRTYMRTIVNLRENILLKEFLVFSNGKREELDNRGDVRQPQQVGSVYSSQLPV